MRYTSAQQVTSVSHLGDAVKLHSSPIPDSSADDEPSPMRAAVRFPLHLPVQLRTDTGLIPAVTEDISSTGALFLTADAPLVGSMLEWHLHLPAATMGTSASVQVDCVGRVVWTRRDPDGVRLGALIDHYELKDERP